MGLVVVVGEAATVRGFALAGAVVRVADDADAVGRAWAELPADTAVVVLTDRAAAALGPDTTRAHAAPLTVVMPP